MNKLVYIFFGGLFGGILRYLLSVFEEVIFKSSAYSIITVNLLGVLVLVAVNVYAENRDIDRRSGLYLTITVGLLGAFTSFSSFIKDIVVFGQESMIKGIIYISVSIIGSYAMVLLGAILGRWMADFRRR